MNKRFVVDFRIAAAEQESLFEPGWSWPVPQSSYDDPLKEFVEWAYTLPGELAHDEQLRAAYELVELDMMKDLVAALATWVDVDASRKQNLELVHGPDQTFYKMFMADHFFEYSLLKELRSVRYKTFRSKIGSYVRRLGGKFRFTKLDGQQLVIAPNVLTHQIARANFPVYKLDYPEIVRRRSIDRKTLTKVSDLARTITDQISVAFSARDQNLTPNGTEFISGLLSRYLAAGIADQRFNLRVNSPLGSLHLYTGSGGLYQSRLAAHLIHREGGTVTRSAHGGDTVLFEDPFWVGTEVTSASNYVTYGSTSADIITGVFANHPRASRITHKPDVIAASSTYHQGITEAAGEPVSASAGAGSNVVVISASFTGELRPIPFVKIHDVVYLEWHGRLLQTIKSAGFNTISKRHPKGMSSLQPLFKGRCDVELTGIGMSNIETDIDAFVTDIAASAFLEAMCTMKPVVLIDIPTRRMTEFARKRISESAQIVNATFDDGNRVVIDPDQLIEALRKPVDLDARHRFLNDFLLTPSPGYSSINT